VASRSGRRRMIANGFVEPVVKLPMEYAMELNR
jgi:Fe-S cluster assembly scaffold protein SufB